MLEAIGRYRIESELGEGAMADVYRAFDPSINRALAIKVLKREFLRDRQYADRFLREAKAAGALSHPNIVTIYDVGEADGDPYIVMELLEGRSLDEVLKEGALEPARALGIGIQLADALAFAHRQGVIHRDLKPSNVIVLADGRSIKLLDFGIARVGDALFDTESVRTQVGQVLGTPRYMSPEQALGEKIDGRSDLFSLGVLMYEMLTGRRAFPGASSATLAIQIVQRDPEPLGKIAPDTPGGLQFIVNKLLAKQPERRFADGAQLADAMRKELAALTAAGEEESVQHSYIPIQVRLPIVLALITALLLGGAIWTVLSRQYRAMEQVALASGNAISSFVASNAGLRAVENATLPAAQQDWAPTEAFVRTASQDAAIRRIQVVGADGVVRASSEAGGVGRPYAASRGGDVVERRDGVTVTSEDGRDGRGVFRFVRPITYAGRAFGQVDVEVSKAALDAAARLARLLMAALGLVTLGGVALTSYAGTRTLAAPIRRLKGALLEVARGNLDFQISHNRKDEFGELFDSFNIAAGALQERLFSVEQLALSAPSVTTAASGATDAGFASKYKLAVNDLPLSTTESLAPKSSVVREITFEPPLLEPGVRDAPVNKTPAVELAVIEPSVIEAAFGKAAVIEEAIVVMPEPIADGLPPISALPVEALTTVSEPSTPFPAVEQAQPSTTVEFASASEPAPESTPVDHGDRTQIYTRPAALDDSSIEHQKPVAVAPPRPSQSPPNYPDDDDEGGATLIGPARR